ncbi:MAG: hypothetical protein JWM88_331 [Verrucomicrobia bacterium]|nr:hypothetical protein [Verrucomicrobiota bacterium]
MTSPASNPTDTGAASKVVLLPDALFFARAAAITAGATAAEAAAQVELALEASSPFPAAQLFYGFHWLPGAERALVFAAYRRRFPREQVEAWSGAELVLPAFAALFGSEVEPATTMLVTSVEGLTAIHWDQGRIPAAVLFRPWSSDATEAGRAVVRDELLRGIAASRQVIELPAPPLAEAAARGGSEFSFRAGERVSRLPAASAATLDVRDKAELAAFRQGRARDVMLWRVFIGCAAAIVLVGLGCAGLYGAGFWERTRERKVKAQQPVVDQVMTAQTLSTRINELSSKRLLPLEMISLVSGIKPASIQFQRTTTEGLYTLKVDAQTASPAEVSTFRSALADLPAVERVEVRDQRTRDNLMSFTLVVSFKPDVLKPATPS